MELRQLITFQSVAQSLSFSKAANSLNYAQSTVSAQIQGLEEELGVALFDRLGKRVALTDSGQRFLDYAEQILTLANEAQAVVSSGDTLSGSLVISAAETLCAYRMPAILREFRLRYPQVQLTLRTNPGTDLEQGLRNGSVDIAFDIRETVNSPHLMAEPLIPEKLLILAYPEHPLVAEPAVTFADLHGQPMVLTEKACPYRRMFLRSLKAAEVAPSPLMEFHSVEAIKQSVMAGIGLTLLPVVAVKQETAQRRLVPLNWVGRDFELSTHMIWHKDKWLSPPLRAFMDVAREILGAMAVVDR